MKHFLLFCAALLISTQNIHAQDHWEPVNLPASGTDVLLVRSDNSGLIVIGTPDEIYHSSDEGSSWTPSGNWPGYQPNAIAFNSENTLFIGSYLFGMYRSYDSGLTFEPINDGLTVQIIHCILVNGNDDLLIGTPLGIFRSVNDGDDWSVYGSGLPNDYVMTLIQTDNGDLFCGTRENGIYISTDEGATWTASGNGLPANAEVTAMASVPQGPVFAGIFPEGMYRSTDNGNTWEPFNDGLPFDKKGLDTRGSSVDRLIFSNFYLYCIIYFFGAYLIPITLDGSDTWIQVNGGLPEDPTTVDLAVAPGNKIFLAASDQGLFRTIFPVGISQQVPVQKTIIRISPNPVQGSATFTIQLSEKQHITLAIWNAQGELSGIVFQGTLPEGITAVPWETASLPAGIYLYRFVGEHSNETGKILVR